MRGAEGGEGARGYVGQAKKTLASAGSAREEGGGRWEE